MLLNIFNEPSMGSWETIKSCDLYIVYSMSYSQSEKKDQPPVISSHIIVYRRDIIKLMSYKVRVIFSVAD